MPKVGKIQIIMTGGTIDGCHGDGDKRISNTKSLIPNFIESLKLYETFSFNQVCMKDSRDLNGEDLEKILESVEKSVSKYVIITHGTYTMPVTARYLENKLKRKDQNIILTGSMIPLEDSSSDAPFNLGYSLASLKTLNPGIYVCMNGRIFRPEEVEKDVSKERFVSNKN